MSEEREPEQQDERDPDANEVEPDTENLTNDDAQSEQAVRRLIDTVQTVERRMSMSVSWSGPLPPASEIGLYKEHYDDAPRIIFETFEKQANHRMRMEAQKLEKDLADRRLGLILAFAAFVVLVLFGGWLTTQGETGWGISLIFSGIAAVIGTFVYVERRQRKELERKRDLAPIPDE